MKTYHLRIVPFCKQFPPIESGRLVLCLDRENIFNLSCSSRLTLLSNEMAPLAANRKRKQNVKEVSPSSDTETFPAGGLDLSGDEDEQENGLVQDSDIDEVDPFPEIDAASDTDEEEGESSGDDAKLSEIAEDAEDDEDASSDDDLHIFPKAKTVISNITGQSKKVYPEIEPDYDSDSSTEDVRAFFAMFVRVD